MIFCGLQLHPDCLGDQSDSSSDEESWQMENLCELDTNSQKYMNGDLELERVRAATLPDSSTKATSPTALREVVPTNSGSKNPATTTTNSSESSFMITSSTTKRERSISLAMRPAKTTKMIIYYSENVTHVKKRGRGRPKGSKNTSTAKKTVTTSKTKVRRTSKTAAVTAGNRGSQQNGEKRGRGRPRKNPFPPVPVRSASQDVVSQNDGLSIRGSSAPTRGKRKRSATIATGPRKRLSTATISSHALDADTGVESQETNGTDGSLFSSSRLQLEGGELEVADNQYFHLTHSGRRVSKAGPVTASSIVRAQLENSTTSSTNKGMFPCADCKRNFDSHRGLCSHQRRSHRKPYRCIFPIISSSGEGGGGQERRICSEAFIVRKACEAHVREHLGSGVEAGNLQIISTYIDHLMN